jgi:hypothetical protein
MAMTGTQWLAMGAVGAVGVAAGWGLHAPARDRTPTAPVEAPARAPAPTVEGAQLALLFRSIVREEMERALPRAAVPPANVAKETVPAPPPAPTAEQMAARDRGLAIVDGALSARRWTQEDKQQLRSLLPQLDEATRIELVRSLLPAINRQEIKMETQGSPL